VHSIESNAVLIDAPRNENTILPGIEALILHRTRERPVLVGRRGTKEVSAMDNQPVAEGRQDAQAPTPTVEKSDPTPVDKRRGQRLWLGVVLVAIIFIAAAIIAATTR